MKLFLEAMRRGRAGDGSLEEAYRLMSAESRALLEDRAHLATSLTGAELEPWELLVQGRFRLRVAPAEMSERIQGDRAIVTIKDGKGGRAEVEMVREAGKWRVVVDLPPAREPATPAPHSESKTAN